MHRDRHQGATAQPISATFIQLLAVHEAFQEAHAVGWLYAGQPRHLQSTGIKRAVVRNGADFSNFAILSAEQHQKIGRAFELYASAPQVVVVSASATLKPAWTAAFIIPVSAVISATGAVLAANRRYGIAKPLRFISRFSPFVHFLNEARFHFAVCNLPILDLRHSGGLGRRWLLNVLICGIPGSRSRVRSSRDKLCADPNRNCQHHSRLATATKPSSRQVSGLHAALHNSNLIILSLILSYLFSSSIK